MTPEPDEHDLAVRDTLVAALAPFGSDVADVALSWSEPAHTWFTVVTPRARGAAPLEVAVDDRADLSLLVTVGATTGEFAGLSAPMEWLSVLATAVFAGRASEAGRSGQHLRVLLDDGTVVTVRRGLPWPGMWRSAAHHAPYGLRATDGLRRVGTFLRDLSGDVSAHEDVDHLAAWVEWPDVSDGEYTDVITIDGHVVELAATPDERVVATVTSTVDLARLRMLAEAAAAQAGLPADQDARAVWRATVRR
ncbi:hypothetical protein [Cellulomonas sp. Root137]|uniref:hypothetical protein n=1 Tax=Cellulomonas sp. Root137 TaxID=1736459 RepID=UPI0006FB184B|nr:hypothetical protein [Cellulomonas sp. Root137]KQY41991.1 hypothetical protein ASD18_20410 [Cellulomonas sp. Root137]